ncbi:MAG: energy-coupling factor ABC transporter ATP-binding protein [Methanomicrobiaceae archaeon]|nr:energy-coupling factor ABC transporter ATP-binding protein [Methanomicrobiaceae archaeon]
MTADTAIEFRGFSFRHPASRSARPREVLSGIDCIIWEGERVLLTGPSGSGKTTFLRCCNGLIPHARPGTLEGDVFVRGRNTRDCTISDLATTVGMVFQDPDHQIFSTDVLSEIAFGPEQLGWPSSRIDRAVTDVLHLLRFDHLADRQTTELSWGERQRLAIASIVVVHPAILVLDEPFSGLDVASAAGLLDLLDTLNRESGMTIILSEHRAELVAPWASRQITLVDGTIAADDRPPAPCAPPLSTSPHRAARAASAGIVTLEGVTFRHPGRETPALDDVSLTIHPGEVTVLAGPNGSGKSTLLKHLNGLLQPESGQITVNGRDTRDGTVAEIARTVGLVCQHADYQLFGETIAEELAFAPANLGISSDVITQRIASVREHLGIGHLGLEVSPLALSVGEKQRVSIASVLTMDTPVLALDEPTLGLDPGAKQRLAGVITTLCAGGKAVVVATHDTEFSRAVADRIVRIERGRIVGDHRVPEEGV